MSTHQETRFTANQVRQYALHGDREALEAVKLRCGFKTDEAAREYIERAWKAQERG